MKILKSVLGSTCYYHYYFFCFIRILLIHFFFFDRLTLSRVHLKTMIITRSASHYTRTRHWSLSWATWIHSTFSNCIQLQYHFRSEYLYGAKYSIWVSYYAVINQHKYISSHTTLYTISVNYMHYLNIVPCKCDL